MVNSFEIISRYLPCKIHPALHALKISSILKLKKSHLFDSFIRFRPWYIEHAKLKKIICSIEISLYLSFGLYFLLLKFCSKLYLKFFELDLVDTASYIDGIPTPKSSAAFIVQTPVPFCPITGSTSSIKY